jgi:DNA-binding NarL/FixJ family response regulator
VLAGQTTVSAVDDDQMLLDGLAAWFADQPDLLMIFTCGGVDELIRDEPAPADVVLLEPSLGGADGHDIRRLVAAGRRVLVVSGALAADQLTVAVRAGARGYVTRDRDLFTLAAAIRRVATGGTAYPAAAGPRPAHPPSAHPPAHAPACPPTASRRPAAAHPLAAAASCPPVTVSAGGAAALTPRERELVVAYTSGLTMAAAARRIGVRPSTAKTYLERIKRKYAGAGRPTYTKLDLAARAREDGL